MIYRIFRQYILGGPHVHRQTQRTQRAFSTRPTPRRPRISRPLPQQDRRRDGQRQKERCCTRLKWCYRERRSIERRPVSTHIIPSSSTGAPAPSTTTVSTSHPTNSSIFVHRLLEGPASSLRQRLEIECESQPASPVALAASTIEVHC